MRHKMTKLVAVLLSLLMLISLIPTSGLTAEAAIKPKLTKKASTITIGSTAQIKVKNAPKGAKITYKSAKRSIATVSKTGRVKGIKNGKAKIIVTIKKKLQIKKLSYKVTVKKPSMSKKVVSLSLGDTAKLAIKNRPKKASYVWESSSPQIAAVNQNGTVTANSGGTVTINTKVKTAKKTYNLSCFVTVSADSNNEARTYTVIFDSNGGTAVPSQTVEKNGLAYYPSTPVRNGYIFNGWYTMASGGQKFDFNTTINENIVLYAHWTDNSGTNNGTQTYTVTFNSNGGSFVAPQTVIKNGTAQQPANPTRNGYTFDGWYTAANGGQKFNFTTVIRENIVLYAHWFSSDSSGNSSGGSGNSNNSGGNSGGSGNSGNGGNSNSGQNNETQTYTVTFDSNGGSTVTPQTVKKNSLAQQPAEPTRNGYKFDGWYTAASGGQKFSFDTAITANITLYAHWNKDNDTQSDAPKITINNFSETETNNVDTDSISVSGLASAYSGDITSVTYSLKFTLDETASVSGEADGSTEWKIEKLPLQIGTSFLTIAVTDSENRTAKKEITLNRLSTQIELSENVVLYTPEQTAGIAKDIFDYWIDDRNTVDTYDDQTNILFAENSEIVKSIKGGSIKTGDVVMLQPCNELYLGFNGVLISNKEPEDSAKYPASKYEVVSFRSADYTDIFDGDVSLSYELADVANPLVFAYFPSEVEMYSMDNNGNIKAKLYSNVKSDKEKPGDQSVKQEIKQPGFQKNAISYMMNDALNITGGLSSDNGMNIGIKFKDAVFYDEDGKDSTTNDQFKFGGSISFNNFKVNAGIEWHPNWNPIDLDLLPQQVIGKYSYTETVDAHADWTGKLDLKGLVEKANKSLNNNFENNKQFMGMTLSGVDLSDSIILGAFGLQIAPTSVAPIVGIKNAQYSSTFTPLSAILIIMPVVNVDGELSAKVGLTYKYTSYNEKGINMQKRDYVGPYGPLSENKGQTSKDVGFDRSLEIYDVCSKSSTDKNSDPAWSLSLEGDGNAKVKIAIGADIGLMMAGIMPTSAEAKLYANSEVEGKVKLSIDNEKGLTVDALTKADNKVGVMSAIHFKLAVSSDLLSPEIKGDKKWDLVLLEAGWSTAYVDGTVYKADADTDNTNNEKIADATITLQRTDQLGQPTRTTTSDSDGKYRFDNVPEGKYKLTFNKNGFDTYETEITVSDSHKTVDAFLASETSIFKQLPQEFVFTSGAGGWATVFNLNPDGTFTGQYHDSEGISTVFICKFEGKFTIPQKINEYMYSMNLEYLNIEGTPGDKYYENGIHYIYSEPYGFDDANEFYIYLPGCPLKETSEEFISWSFINAEIRETIPIGIYGIYNVSGKEGFTGHTENNLWNKSYKYDYGSFSSYLSPSYSNESTLLFYPEKGSALLALALHFKWSHDGQTTFEAYDGRGSGDYDISLEFGNDPNSILVTVKSRSGTTDFTSWGGTKNGTLTAEYRINK